MLITIRAVKKGYVLWKRGEKAKYCLFVERGKFLYQVFNGIYSESS